MGNEGNWLVFRALSLFRKGCSGSCPGGWLLIFHGIAIISPFVAVLLRSTHYLPPPRKFLFNKNKIMAGLGTHERKKCRETRARQISRPLVSASHQWSHNKFQSETQSVRPLLPSAIANI